MMKLVPWLVGCLLNACSGAPVQLQSSSGSAAVQGASASADEAARERERESIVRSTSGAGQAALRAGARLILVFDYSGIKEVKVRPGKQPSGATIERLQQNGLKNPAPSRTATTDNSSGEPL